MAYPQSEAISIFESLLDAFFKGIIDIKNALRHCAHACQILGWTDQLKWFDHELRGYPEGVEIPYYRKVKGHTDWIPTGGFGTVLDSVIDDQHRITKKRSKVVTFDVWHNIDWVLSAANYGYRESTGKKSSKYVSFRHKNIQTELFHVYDKSAFQTIISEVEALIFTFTSKSYSLLLYADALEDIWKSYRAHVDEALISIGLQQHFDTIRSGLISQNPQDWRAAMWSCRDLLHDLADYLWKDPRPTYTRLSGKDGYLAVTNDKYVNRLGAYLHYKGITGKKRGYLFAEMERIYHSIDTLNELDSEAHSQITLLDLRMAAIGTYFIVGELAARTDMKPVENYDNL